ncbi:ATP-binding cassette domain-containing protein, partial [Microbacteriaceae bacterium K1510]|nr:ATP-binding cassette domain-containing protein [Microbacteriaceae bacterium K1510]
GAGKTSLLRLLFMSRHPTSGQLFLFNQDVSRISTSKRALLRRRIGIVFQDFRLLDHLTTWENVALPLRVLGKRLADYREDVTDLLQ